MKDARPGNLIVDAFDVGQTVGGKYQIQRVIGRGGMGLVVEALHLGLSARVAIKFLVPELAQNPEAAARFLREARTTFGIRSPHIVSVLDVGHTDAGSPFIVMEHLDGEDVGARLQRLGTMTEPEAIEIVRQAAQGVAHAHSLGIIHRDLKPSNLLCIEGSGGALVVKVVDFGISKLTPSSPLEKDNLIATQTATVLGSPLYMAPEQLQSAKHLDEGCDIWALGVILFELLAGRPPFLGQSVTEVAINVATQPLPPLVELRADISPRVQAVVVRCLQKVRADRFPTIDELLAALRDCTLPAPSPAPVAVVPAVGTTPVGTTPVASPATPVASPATPVGLGSAKAVSEPAGVQTLTFDGLPSKGSLTHAPVSTTQPPGGLTKHTRTKIATGAVALALSALIGGLVLSGRFGPTHSDPSRAAADEPAPAVGDFDPGVVDTVAREVVTREVVTREVVSSAAPPAAASSAPVTEHAVARPPIALKSREEQVPLPKKPPATGAANLPAPSSAAVPPKAPPPPCAPYYMRNGVRVFNDACILQREAQKARPAPVPSKTRNP